MKIIKFFKNIYKSWKQRKDLKRRIEEIKRRDPFTYKNF